MKYLTKLREAYKLGKECQHCADQISHMFNPFNLMTWPTNMQELEAMRTYQQKLCNRLDEISAKRKKMSALEKMALQVPIVFSDYNFTFQK